MIHPPPIWTPPTPTLILPGRTAERVAASSKRMLLVRPDFGFRPSPPAIVQTAKRQSDGNLVFPNPTTVGSLFVAMGGRRQNDVFAPTDGGTWHLQGGDLARNTTSSREHTVGAWTRLATAATTTYSWTGAGVTPLINLSMWEVSGASEAGITAFLLSTQPAATAHDLGDLGVLTAYRLAFGIWADTADVQVETITPGVWVRTKFCNRDQDSDVTGFGNVLTDGGFPFVWSGHTAGAGIDVHGRIDSSISKSWDGVVVLLA